MTTTPTPHLRYLDGLRGVAILLVVMVHAGLTVPGLPKPVEDATFYGAHGVQLFFIVSGLTLALNYAGKRFVLADFAARRFFRIAPMFYLGGALYLLLGAVTDLYFWTPEANYLDVLATIFFIHGWFPSAINTVVPGGWSIAAEAMFYLIFPLILVVTRRASWTAVALAASYLVAGLCNIALKHFVGGTREGDNFTYHFWLCHLPAFVGGCWLAVAANKWQVPRALALATLTAAVVGMVVDSQLRGRSNLLVAIFLLTLLVWSCGVVRPRVLEGRWLPLIGEISFSLYILHFLALAVLRLIEPVLVRQVGPIAAMVITYCVALASAGSVSFFTYRFIEKPAVRAARRLRSAH